MREGTDQDRVLLGLVWSAGDSVRKLADAMSDVQAMSTPNLRQQVFEFVKGRNRAFDPCRSDRGMAEINNFILACRADDESFDLLLEAIEMYTSEGDPKLSKLENLVNTLLPRAALTKRELRDLLALEPDKIAKADQLVTGIRKARPESIDREGRDITPGNVRDAALFLLEAPSAEKGLCRLLRFVDWLAEVALVMCDSADASMAEQLRDWTERVGRVHGLTATAWQTSAGPARPYVAGAKDAIGTSNSCVEDVAARHPVTEQPATSSEGPVEAKARSWAAHEAGRQAKPRYLVGDEDISSAAILSPHERSLRALSDALKRIVPSIFRDPRIRDEVLDAANKALFSINPLIQALRAAVEEETKQPMRYDLQQLDEDLRKHQIAVSKTLSALDESRSQRAVKKLCDTLVKEADDLLAAGEQFFRYVT